MSHTTREPSTKFYGPNYPIVPIAAPNHWLVRLHNLKPGDTWNPIWAQELALQFTLTAHPVFPIWFSQGLIFWASIQWSLTNRVLIVRERFAQSNVFLLNVPFAVTKWGMNELLVPDDNFAYDGSCEMIFRKA